MDIKNKEMARLEVKVVKVTQERDARVANEDHYLLKAQCVPNLAENPGSYVGACRSLRLLLDPRF